MLTLHKVLIDPSLSAHVPFLRLGVADIEEIRNGPSTEPLKALVASTVNQTAASLQLAEINQHPAIAGWRKVLKALGTDPSRYRVSSERLLRRVVKGDGLPEVNLMVDLVNLWSLVSGLPIGLYDNDRLAGPTLTFGAGRPGERYATLAGSDLETAGKPVLRDGLGPCGSPLTDSARTATDGNTTRCLAVIFGPPLFDAEEFDRHFDLLCDWVHHFTTGRVRGRQVVEG